MKTYEIFENPKTGEYKAVKLGWSWPAFFFTFIWALYNKLWTVVVGQMFGLGMFFIIISSREPDFDIEAAVSIIGIVLCLMYGSYGNKWLKQEGVAFSKGFTKSATLVAQNPKSAIALFLQSR